MNKLHASCILHFAPCPRFNKLIDQFVATFITPRMGEEEEASRLKEATSIQSRVGGGAVAYQRAGPVAYQRDVVLRVVLPQGKTTTDLHCDADYHHPPWELNWSACVCVVYCLVQCIHCLVQ